jgi:hypothetical protein
VDKRSERQACRKGDGEESMKENPLPHVALTSAARRH